PTQAARSRHVTGFLAERGIVRALCADPFQYQRFGAPVGIAHHVGAARFCADAASRLPASIAKQRAGRARGSQRQLQEAVTAAGAYGRGETSSNRGYFLGRLPSPDVKLMRRRSDDSWTPLRESFTSTAVRVERAQRALLAAIPTARDPG